ncbi:MAG: hypothetical protein RL131_756 [Bacteroidota bacterium]|jgi:pyridoxal phosphate enzyme (YggS family)
MDIVAYTKIKAELDAAGATLVAVSKTKPVEDILALYELGHRDFGENYVQELVSKQAQLPSDIRWHFIGHLQGNKAKMIAPFVHLIHGIDSIKLMDTLDKEGRKIGRVIHGLLQVHIAKEETKFGFDLNEARQALSIHFLEGSHEHLKIRGLMGMASFTDDKEQVKQEFQSLKGLFDEIHHIHPHKKDQFNTLSMGMSGDYPIALECGSNLVRVGSLLFGSRA